MTRFLISVWDWISPQHSWYEDEYDFEDAEGDIIEVDAGRCIYRVKAATAIEDLNEHIGSSFATEDYDTIGGLVVKFGTMLFGGGHS